MSVLCHDVKPLLSNVSEAAECTGPIFATVLSVFRELQNSVSQL